MDNKTLSGKLCVKKRILACLIGAVLVALLIWAIGIVVGNVIYYESLEGVHSITIL